MDVAGERMQFLLVYDGPALQEHRMDVRDLAPALLAMGDLVERANELFNGDQAKIAVNVHASFKTGSFGIDLDLLQSLWQKVLDFGTSRPVVAITDIAALLGLAGGGAKGVIHIIKWLRGRGVTKIEPLHDGVVRLWVENDHIEIEERALTLLQDFKIREGLEKVIAKPLEKEGIDSFATEDKQAKEVLVHIGKSEARFFRTPPAIDEIIDQDERDAILQVLNIAFKDDNKWRFTEGATAFYAPILDDEFLDRVSRNQELFAKDDLLRVRLRRTQRLSATDGLKIDFEVLRVLEHRSASPKVQLRIDFGAEQSGPDDDANF